MLKPKPPFNGSGYSELFYNGSPAPTGTHPFIGKVKQAIRVNLGNEQFDVAFLAERTNMSVSQLNRKLNALIGQPAGQLIWEMRMDHAAYLLSRDVYSIGQIALQAGYQNQSHFCRSFKRRHYCTPSEFRKNNCLY